VAARLANTQQVVPQASAVVPGAAYGEPIAMHADHIKMVKFEVSGYIRVMAMRAGSTIGGRWKTQSRVHVGT
jgi:hypothetical protein